MDTVLESSRGRSDRARALKGVNRISWSNAAGEIKGGKGKSKDFGRRMGNLNLSGTRKRGPSEKGESLTRNEGQRGGQSRGVAGES